MKILTNIYVGTADDIRFAIEDDFFAEMIEEYQNYRRYGRWGQYLEEWDEELPVIEY